MKIILLITICWICFPATFAHVRINYPAGDEKFKSGDAVTINWYIEVDHGDCTWNIYFSDDNGSTWSVVAENLSKSLLEYNWRVPENRTSYGKIKIIQNNYIGTDYETESGAFTISAELTGIPPEEIPDEYLLYTAYPNPFNSSTKISFFIPQEDHAELIIYNAAGEKIITLINENMQAGFHTFRWNADGLASGVYLYSLRTRNFFQIKKAVLIK